MTQEAICKVIWQHLGIFKDAASRMIWISVGFFRTQPQLFANFCWIVKIRIVNTLRNLWQSPAVSLNGPISTSPQ